MLFIKMFLIIKNILINKQMILQNIKKLIENPDIILNISVKE